MAEDSGQISAKQITMVLGLVTTIAGAVAGCLMMLYGNQIDAIRQDSSADLLRLETQIQRLDDACEEASRRMQQTCEDRLDDRDIRIDTIMSQLQDVKEMHRQTITSLESCLDEIQ
mgnify:FL=1